MGSYSLWRHEDFLGLPTINPAGIMTVILKNGDSLILKQLTDFENRINTGLLAKMADRVVLQRVTAIIAKFGKLAFAANYQFNTD